MKSFDRRMHYNARGKVTHRRRTKDGQRFLYDGYLQVANERTVSNEVVRQSFVWDPTEPVATRPLAWFDSNAPPRLYTHDGNKNVSEVVAATVGEDSDAELLAHYDYAAFGAVIAQKGGCAEANHWRFSSEYEDVDFWLVYYNYRHYEPVTGRWMSRDLSGEWSNVFSPMDIEEEVWSENLYGMCDNAPNECVDIIGAFSSRKGRYGQKKQRRFQDSVDKIDRDNMDRQALWRDLKDFVENWLDQREDDPRTEFIREGSAMCSAVQGRGECPACCVIMGKILFGEKLEIVSTSVQCKSCEAVADTGFLIPKGHFIKLAPLSVGHCGD